MLLKTIYEKIGGEDFVSFVADDFTHRVLSDLALTKLYEDYDFARLAARHREWVTHVLGGKLDDEYRLRYVNRKFVEERGVTESQYELISSHLINTLKTFDIPKSELKALEKHLSEISDICLHRNHD